MVRTKKTAPPAPVKWEDMPEIPREQQPYPLPEGWKWVRLGDVNVYKGKIINPLNEKNKVFELYSVPSSATNYPEIVKGADIGSSKQGVEKNDVLLCKINPRINRVWLVEGFTDNELLASSEWIVFRNKYIDSKYIRFYFTSPVFREYMLSNVSGVGGSLMRAQPKFVKTYPLPLPPLKTQHRIATALESLFSQLDEAAEKVQTVIDSHEARKQAILHQAFSGELTRGVEVKEEGITKDISEVPAEGRLYPIPDGWKWVRLSNVAKWGSGGTPSRKHPEYYTGQISWLKTGELADSEIYSTEEHITTEALNNSSAKLFPINTVIIAMYGATIGKLGILKIVAATNQACACAQCHDFIHYKYLFFYLLSQRDAFIKLGKGGAQPNISQEVIKNFPIPLPSLIMQKCLVERIESFFSKLEQGFESCQATLKKIHHLRKSVLNNAFRGKLT